MAVDTRRPPLTLVGMSDATSSGDPAPRRGRLILAGLLALALVVVAALLLRQPDSRSEPAPAAGPTPGGQLAPPPAASPVQETAVLPTAPPPDVTWELFQGVALPSSPTAGPRRVDGPVHAGYEHSPTGALLAAVQIPYRMLITPDDGWRPVVDQQLVANSGREIYRANRSKVTDDRPASGYAQLAGFRFITYDPAVAVIGVVNRSSNGVLQAGTRTLRWLDGDWKVELGPDGGLGLAQPVRDLAGYVPWRGVS